MIKNDFHKKIAGYLFYYLVALLLLRVTGGAFAVVVAAMGIAFALGRRIGLAWASYILLNFMVVTNPVIWSKTSSLFPFAVRFGPLIIALFLGIAGYNEAHKERPPFGSLLPFLVCATISSAVGFVPAISYLKLVNFIAFFCGIWLGCACLKGSPAAIQNVRAAFMAIAIVVVLGSLATIPFPGISTLSGLDLMRIEQAGQFTQRTAADIQVGSVGAGSGLFCGVTFQSQTLAPVLSCLFGLLMCDMFFVEKRLCKLHGVLIVVILPLLFLTRSRTGLLALLVGIGMVFVYTSRRIQMPIRTRQLLSRGILIFVFLVVIAALVSEFSTGAMTRWVRKTDDLGSDNLTLTDAVTGSRQGLIENSLYEFKQNPLFGIGFQTCEEHKYLYQRTSGLLLSAPVEKGLLVLMVLGETGVVGAFFFYVFLVCFCLECAKHHYYCLLTLFLVQIATNFGEATFFSPGGAGGIEWTLCVIGGWALDMKLLAENRQLAR